MSALTLGISSCPNDTYIFDALVHGRVPAPFTTNMHMADVEELNRLARQGALDISKLSLAVMPYVVGQYVMLNAGAALGRGCGPLLVARGPLSAKDLRRARIAIPGALTTASLLLSLHGGFEGPRAEYVFDQVMPAVLEGHADLGLIIHEGRFTYAERGLSLVLDFGDWWEKETGLPLPLGVIAARRDLGPERLSEIDRAVRQSLEHARKHPEDARPFIRAHAQEMELAVMESHIKTFVNDFSLDLGLEGRAAVTRLLEAGARAAGMRLSGMPLFVDIG